MVQDHEGALTIWMIHALRIQRERKSRSLQGLFSLSLSNSPIEDSVRGFDNLTPSEKQQSKEHPSLDTGSEVQHLVAPSHPAKACKTCRQIEYDVDP